MKELENKLQFVVTLSLFFPVAIATVVDEDLTNKATGAWGMVIVFLILIYLYLSLSKKVLTQKQTERISFALDMNIFLFIPFIVGIALATKNPYFANILFVIGLVGISLLPIGTFILVFTSLIVRLYKKIFS